MLNVLNKEKVDEIIQKYKNGESLTRKEKIFYRGEEHTRNKRSMKFAYALNNDELREFENCFRNAAHFIEKHCGLKLKDFQIEWIVNFLDNKFTINMCSEEMDFQNVMAALYLWQTTIFHDQTIQIIASKSSECDRFIELVWMYYKRIPFFLKRGVQSKNKKNIVFDNSGRIMSKVATKNTGIGYNIDILSFINFAHIKPNTAQTLYISLYPIMDAKRLGKINIHSTPNGNNMFKELVERSELKEGHPKKNLYKTIRTYWWEDPEHDDEWVKKKTGEDVFKQYYEIEF